MDYSKGRSYKLSRFLFGDGSSSKENVPASLAQAGKPQNPSSSSLLTRRVTYPNASGKLTSLVVEEKPSDAAKNPRREGSFDSFRKPLANLNSLNTNLQHIFHSKHTEFSSKTRSNSLNCGNEAGSSDASFSDSSDLIDLSQDQTAFFDSSSTCDLFSCSLQDQLLYSTTYLQESVELQLLDHHERKANIFTSSLTRNEHKMRILVVDWIFTIQGYFNLPDMVSHIAIQIFDQVMQEMEISEKEMQLVGGAAFWLASKMEANGESVSGNRMKRVIGKTCSVAKLKSAEFVVFKRLNYCIPRDSALSIHTYQLHSLRSYFPVDDELQMIGQYALETSMLSLTMSLGGYTVMASSATICAILICGHTLSDVLWNFYSRNDSSFAPLEDAIKGSLVTLHKLMDLQKLKHNGGNLWLKFGAEEKMKIALNPKLSAENISKILQTCLWFAKK
ncbi:G2/mitotic-specific cyclin-B1-like [Neocloeon triangulifer]|uniref:G2/mitotic-specific cyclin-B1-like n=1 Tax=Neocloeon triangulifer TaxID=2078957 RepID=UPI00286F3FE7|nr:G2/mitotic-specific cyclin-B1-like [Neocloeon triangulifer]XP_059490388.1 G2/mitotic-specific cyclin-B1-like [Neocloeon triangulifer]